jgi:hypothetical protein
MGHRDGSGPDRTSHQPHRSDPAGAPSPGRSDRPDHPSPDEFRPTRRDRTER